MVRCSPARVAYLVPGGGSAGTKGQYRNTARTITAAVATDAAVTHQCRELRSGASCNACRAALLSATLLRMTAWLSCHMACACRQATACIGLHACPDSKRARSDDGRGSVGAERGVDVDIR